MPIRYYPLSKVKIGKVTTGQEFTLGGKEYKGKYYETFDGKFFTGENPIVGPNERLQRFLSFANNEYLNTTPMKQSLRSQLAAKNKDNVIFEPPPDQTVPGVSLPQPKFKGEPTSYFPVVLPEDYAKGAITRFFAKRVNTKGYVTEISEQEYVAIKNGQVPYDVSNYLTIKIFWKITGPLNQKRISQYDIRAGIIDTNKRLVENAEKTFLGIVAFIGGDYSKFARPTE